MAVASPIEAATRQRTLKKNAMDSDSLAIAPGKNKKRTTGNFFDFFSNLKHICFDAIFY